MVRDTVAAQFATVPDAARDCDVLLAFGAMQIAARSVAEALGIRYVYGTYSPTTLPSAYHAPVPLRGWPQDESDDTRRRWAADRGSAADGLIWTHAAVSSQVSGIDRVLRIPVRIGTGFGLPTPEAYWYSPTAFDFPGYSGGFADPATGLAFAYVMNHVQEGVPDHRAASLLDATRNAMAAG